MVNLKISKKKIVKIGKLKISKNKNITFVRTTEKKIQEMFGKIQKWFEECEAFWTYCSHMPQC